MGQVVISGFAAGEFCCKSNEALGGAALVEEVVPHVGPPGEVPRAGLEVQARLAHVDGAAHMVVPEQATRCSHHLACMRIIIKQELAVPLNLDQELLRQTAAVQMTYESPAGGLGIHPNALKHQLGHFRTFCNISDLDVLQQG